MNKVNQISIFQGALLQRRLWYAAVPNRNCLSLVHRMRSQAGSWWWPRFQRVDLWSPGLVLWWPGLYQRRIQPDSFGHKWSHIQNRQFYFSSCSVFWFCVRPSQLGLCLLTGRIHWIASDRGLVGSCCKIAQATSQSIAVEEEACHSRCELWWGSILVHSVSCWCRLQMSSESTLWKFGHLNSTLSSILLYEGGSQSQWRFWDLKSQWLGIR